MSSCFTSSHLTHIIKVTFAVFLFSDILPGGGGSVVGVFFGRLVVGVVGVVTDGVIVGVVGVGTWPVGVTLTVNRLDY